jgi:hypothetical protein
MSMLSQWRERINSFRGLYGSRGKAVAGSGDTLVVTHAELSARHGTGALLVRILGTEQNLMAFHSREFFKTHDMEVAAFPVDHSRGPLGAGRKRVRQLLKGKAIGRILCVPFYEDEVHSALAAQAHTGAPLALYIMDDQNIHVKEISDSLMRTLIQRAKICFAISPALCAAYQEKYQRRFWFVPPVADPGLFVPADYHFIPNSPPHGILIGNLWSSHTLSRFCETVGGSGLQIDWCGNAGRPFITLDPDELAKEGIFLRSHLPEASLIELARTADFAVIPAGILDGSDTHEWLAKASLPSRIVYLMATANVPMIVMGHPETAAAQFVTAQGLGVVCDYTAESFQAAVRKVADRTVSANIRERAHHLSPTFSSRELSNWLWQSMKQGRAMDDRFETLIRPPR